MNSWLVTRSSTCTVPFVTFGEGRDASQDQGMKKMGGDSSFLTGGAPISPFKAHGFRGCCKGAERNFLQPLQAVRSLSRHQQPIFSSGHRNHPLH